MTFTPVTKMKINSKNLSAYFQTYQHQNQKPCTGHNVRNFMLQYSACHFIMPAYNAMTIFLNGAFLMKQQQSELKQLSLDQLVRGEYHPRRHFDQTQLQELADSIKTTRGL